ncbi:tape measure protein [Bacteroides sedimenti]
MIETARETNRARVALRNISGTMAGYVRNQEFLIDLAKQYGQELNVLTGNYARFSAAATSGGVSVADQEKIFTAITRASTAFGLSAEESNLSFLAITQMMAKGKISSEELRRQLGERMPIAMEAMARAAGVSIQQLDKLLKNGELYAKDILPKFAEEMEKMLPNVNTDNIETSLNRLKTAFIEFTDNTGIGNAYKTLIDGIAKGMEYLQNNLRTVVRHIAAIITGVLINKGLKEVVLWIAKIGRLAETEAIKGTKGAARSAAKLQFEANKTANVFSFALNRVKIALKTAFVTTGIMALIMLVTDFIFGLIEAEKEANAIRSIFSDYQKELKAVNGGEEAAKLKSLLAITQDKEQTHKDINAAQRELMKMLGLEKASQEELNREVAKRVKLLEATAKADFYARSKVESEAELNRIYAKYGGEGKLNARFLEGEKFASSDSYNAKFFWDANKELFNDMQKAIQLRAIMKDADKNLGAAVLQAQEDPIKPKNTEDAKDKTDLQKAEEKYAKEMGELNNQIAIRAIKEEEYNKAVDALNKKTYEEIAGLLGKNAPKNATFKKAKAGVDNPLTEAETELSKIQKEYAEDLQELRVLKDKGYYTEKEYNEELASLADKTAKSAGAISDIGAEGEDFVRYLIDMKNQLKPIELPKADARDTTLDYKKSDKDKLSEELSIQEKLVDEWKKLNEETGRFSDELDKAISKSKSTKDALKLAEIKEDIAEYKKDLIGSADDGVRAFYQLGKHIQSAFETLRDPDISGLEKLFMLLEAISRTYDGIMTIVKAVQTFESASTALAAAKQAETVLDATKATTEVTGIEAVSAAKTAADLAEVTSTTAKSTAVVAALGAEQVAAQALMAAASTAAYAGIPFGGVGLAAAQIAEMKALIMAASIPMFADGGIVGGNSFEGDKVLARLNSGEMVLNKGQQTRLFDALNGKSALGANSPSGKVVFEISGKKLLGILEQETKRNMRT